MKPEFQRSWLIRYIIPNTSNPTQETIVKAPNPQMARRVFDTIHTGCKRFGAPKRVDDSE